MKTIFTMLGMLWAPVSFAHQQDTVVIELGENKIIIVVPSKEDFKKVNEYDVNRMLEDLANSIDSVDKETTFVLIEDENGTQYLIKQKDGDRKVVKLSLGPIQINTGDDDENEYDDDDKNDWIDSDVIFELGLNNWLQSGTFPDDENHAVKTFGSWYVGISNTYDLKVFKNLSLLVSPSVSWYNFKFENENIVAVKTPTQVVFSDSSALKYESIKSKLSATYVNMSVVPEVRFGNDSDRQFKLGVGGYAGYRIGGRSKWVYEFENEKQKEIERDSFYMNNFRYGVRGQVAIWGLELFVNYDLNDFFSDGKGPNLQAMSFGVVF